MPLITPDMDPKANKADVGEWENKLMGKTIGDDHSSTAFAKKDLPEKSRVLNEGDMKSMDHDESRLNIHVDKDGTVRKVTKG